MSADAMDIDPVESPGKKRKNKEKDSHSSKKRKHHDRDDQVAESHSKKERKDKERRHKHKHKEDKDVAAAVSSQAQEEPPSSTSRSKKKHSKHHRHRHSKSPTPTAEDHATGTTAARKPLSKPAGSQLAALSAEPSSPFCLVTTSLHLPLSPVSISATNALPSLLSEHISPLLLTYYPPVQGIVLAYSNPSLSSTPGPERDNSSSNPQPLIPAVSAGEYGVLYIYLNITFLVFRPERTQTFEGWINVQSESFLGAVVFNLFSVGIERRRLPPDWKWVAPGEQQHQTQDSDDDSSIDSDKENFRPLPPSAASSSGTLLQGDATADENDELSTGFFQTSSGKRVRGTVRFRIRDVDIIPGSERDKGFISLEGTMLSPEEEEKLVAEERKKAERLSGGGKQDENII